MTAPTKPTPGEVVAARAAYTAFAQVVTGDCFCAWEGLPYAECLAWVTVIQAAIRSVPVPTARVSEQDLWPLGTRVRKINGSSWHGHVCGYYHTALTPNGYAVESERETGSVQLYPEAALERVANPTSPNAAD